MHIGILGAAEVELDGGAVDIGPRKQRALLAALVLHRGQPVSPDALVDLLWGDSPPTAVTPTLQGYVARLRRALEPDRAPRATSQVLVTRPGGYALVLPPGAVDAERFEAAVTASHRRLAALEADPPTGEQLDAVVDELSRALGLWRGQPYPELEDASPAQAERARLEELRVTALEARAVAALGLGRHAVVAGELEVLTATYPLRERLWGLRALALARSGRQADALDVLRSVRELLTDELGLEPGVELRTLQAAVLRQDPALAWSPPPDAVEVVATTPDARSRTTEPVPHPVPLPVPASVPMPAWPLVGRGDQLAALVGTLVQSQDRPVFAVVTGDPGIGKSRLCAELAAVAESEGATVLVGRCSQDDGAPPLHPWAKVLGELGRELPSDPEPQGEDDGGARFRAWEQIARAVLDAARARHLVVVLDDLHWADGSTLRVLRLLAESADSGRLMVLTTWRHQPPPSGLLAEVAEALARRHALRLELTGLSAEEASEVVSSVAATTPTTAEARALRDRTEGNPFFLVEYARLARERGDLAALLAEENPPAAVHDVLARRLAGLPDSTGQVLRWAAVLGRRFDVTTVARLAGTDEETVLDQLDAALDAGLVREDGVDRMRFSHALVRDTVSAGLSQSRRARMHARAAEVLADEPGRASEVARHWFAAGPARAGAAWRAALAAAQAARRVFAHDEAVELLRAAAESVEQDPSATREERYALQLELAHAYQRQGDWRAVRPVIHRAIATAGDLDEVVGAATLSTTNSLWHATPQGSYDAEFVATLRDLLERLPPGDSPQRCRVMLTLATEIYYRCEPAEREALADEAVAMARRLGDPALLAWALLAGYTAVWRGSNAPQRLAMALEAEELTQGPGSEITRSSALTLGAVAAGESGDLARLDDLLRRGRQQAEQHRHLYAQLVLDNLEIPWLAMRGDFDRVDLLIADIVRLGERMSLGHFDDALNGALAMRMVWKGDTEPILGLLEAVKSSALPVTTVVTALWCRLGRFEEARGYLAEHEHTLAAELSAQTWFSPMGWAMGAEAAAHLGRPDLAAATYAHLVELRGRPACAGSGTCLGPADAFLALAAHATGERDLATSHARDAARWCEEWQVPLAAQWFAGVRDTFGF
ncbi:MAG: BTAD domain-containing putative transcriptional regulator [Ornithinibacter sp.]